jgi:ATP-dependent Clp protease protease subunit
MNKLMKLLADNRGIGLFKAEASSNEATIYLYDAIVSDAYWGGVAAADFVQQLASLNVATIHLRINCPGGEVFAAQAMAQAVREHPANIIAHVDGYAASAASWLALACDEVLISEGGYFMIHKAITIAYGNADEFKKQADLLDKIDGTLVASYVKETGQDAQQIADWMAAETWFNAEEAVANGFADKIAEAAPKNMKQWNMAAYNKAPVIPESPITPPANDAQPDEPAIDITQHLRRRLALVEKQAA